MTTLLFFVLWQKDPVICIAGRLKCITGVKSYACNNPGVTNAMNQVTWLMRNTCNRPNVKRNIYTKPSVTHAI